MYLPDKEKLYTILTEEQGYSPRLARALVERLKPLDDVFESAFERWLKDRSIIDLRIEGIALSDVMRNRRCTFLSAVQMLSALLDSALAADERAFVREALNTPATLE